jgi:hypothetical protein
VLGNNAKAQVEQWRIQYGATDVDCIRPSLCRWHQILQTDTAAECQPHVLPQTKAYEFSMHVG